MASFQRLVLWNKAHATLRDIGIDNLLSKEHQPRYPPDPHNPEQKLRERQHDTGVLPLLKYAEDMTIVLARVVWSCERHGIDLATAKAALADAITQRKTRPSRIASIREVIERDVNVALEKLAAGDRKAGGGKRKAAEDHVRNRRPGLLERMMMRTTLEDYTDDIAILQAAAHPPPNSIFAKASEVNVVVEEDSLGSNYDPETYVEDDKHEEQECHGGGFDCEDDIYEEDTPQQSEEEEEYGNSDGSDTDGDEADDYWEDDVMEDDPMEDIRFDEGS